MLKLLFTVDYEIHGSGTGSPGELIVEPTNRMLAQLDRYGARLTIMADVAELLKFREWAEAHGEDRFHYEAIAQQLRRAVRTGHDVQLHVHSGYFNSQFVDGVWRQDYSEYDLARLGYERLLELITRGKAFLEQLLRPVKPDYRCFAFRAANWSMHPTPDIARALTDAGITIDSSVFRGGRHDELVRFDYTDAHSDLVPWPIDPRDVCRRDPEGKLFEFPIYCEQQPLWAFLTLNRIYRVAAQAMNPLPDPGQAAGTGPDAPATLPRRLADRAAMLLRRHPRKADFNQCTGLQLVGALRRAERAHGHRGIPLPFVMIGHSKTFTRINELSLIPLLEYVSRHPDRFGWAGFADFDLERFRTIS